MLVYFKSFKNKFKSPKLNNFLSPTQSHLSKKSHILNYSIIKYVEISPRN
jgi:hypothetical protein